MSSKQATNLGNTVYWPMLGRTGPIDRDLFCAKCSYNLRGLSSSGRCPECGEPFDRTSDVAGSEIPWGSHRVVGWLEAFVKTLRLVLFDTPRLAREAWGMDAPDERDASRFRWICVLHAFAGLMFFWFAVATPLIGKHVGSGGGVYTLYTLGVALFLLLWLRRTSLLMVAFMRIQHLPSDRHRRVIALAHYTSAAMALLPIHACIWMAVALIYRVDGKGGAVFAAAVFTWTLLLLAHFGLWLYNCAALARGVMNWGAREAVTFGAVFLVSWACTTLLYLGVVPFVLIMIARWVLG